MSKQTTIETPRLLLRAAKTEDAAASHESFNDSEVMRYWSELPHPNMARTEEWIAGMVASSQNGRTDFIICLKSTLKPPKAIGKVGIYYARPSNEIGFLLGRSFWGQGLAKEALTAMLDYLFSLEQNCSDHDHESNGTVEESKRGHTQLTVAESSSRWLYPSITADADPRNAASIGLLKRLGFVETGYAEKTIKLGDEWCDSQYLRLNRADWVQQRQ